MAGGLRAQGNARSADYCPSTKRKSSRKGSCRVAVRRPILRRAQFPFRLSLHDGTHYPGSHKDLSQRRSSVKGIDLNIEEGIFSRSWVPMAQARPRALRV